MRILTCALFCRWQPQLSQRRHPNWEHGFSFFPVSNTCLLQQPPWALGWKSPYHGQRRSCRLDNKSVSNWILRKDVSTGVIVKRLSLFSLVRRDFYKLHIICLFSSATKTCVCMLWWSLEPTWMLVGKNVLLKSTSFSCDLL